MQGGCAVRTATRGSSGASRCISSAVTRWACRQCACARAAAGWCLPPTRVISTPTWSRKGRSRSSGRSPIWCRATGGCVSWRILLRTSFRGTILWCWSATRRLRQAWKALSFVWTRATIVFPLEEEPMKKTLSIIAFGVAAAFAASAGAQQPAAPAAAVKNLKFQSRGPASLTLQDNFKMFAERLDKLTSGQIKIDAAAAGQYVPAFEILDATHKKVIDGGHGVAYYWVGKNKTATLFSATPAGPFGMDHFDFLGWMNEGGGMDLYWEFYRAVLKLNIVAWPIGDPTPHALASFQQPLKSLADFKGMKCRQTGIGGESYQRMAMQTRNMHGVVSVPSRQRG